MRKIRNMFLITATAIVLLFAVGTAYAATVKIEGPTEVSKFTDPQFTFDILITDIGSLTNIDLWNIGLAITPESNATLVSASGKADPQYVFFGNSYDFGYTVIAPYHLVIGDATASGGGETDVVNKLLARVEVDISAANVCEWYDVSLFDSGWTFFGDTDGGLDYDVVLAEGYSFHVVPIPGAVWLLGSGLFGLIGLRTRTKKA